MDNPLECYLFKLDFLIQYLISIQDDTVTLSRDKMLALNLKRSILIDELFGIENQELFVKVDELYDYYFTVAVDDFAEEDE